MAYGDLKVRNLIWNTGSGDNTVVLSTLATQSYVTTNFAPKSAPTFAGTINGVDLILSGNLTVSGTQTIINTNVLQVEDKHIEIGKVSTPSDTTADGGGIILKASSDRTFVWINSTDAWTSSEHIQVASGKTFIGDGSTLTALNASNLASGTVPTARLGSGTAGSSNYLRGDGSWQAIATDKIEEGNTSVETVDTGSDGHVKITTEGTESARFSSDGHLLLGTNSGTHRLTVQGTGNEIAKFTGTNSADLRFRNSTSSHLLVYTGTGDSLLLGTNGQNERFRIDNEGKLGIGGANYGTSGQVLTSQGTSGPPSWADAGGGSTVELVADGALAVDDAVYVTSAGKAKKIASAVTENTPIVVAPNSGIVTSANDAQKVPSICYDSHQNRVHSSYGDGSNVLRIYNNKLDSNFQIKNNTYDVLFTIKSSVCDHTKLVYDPNTQRILCLYVHSGNLKAKVISFAESGDGGTYTASGEVTIHNNAASGVDAVYDPTSNKIFAMWSEDNNGGHGACKLLTIDTSGTAPGTVTVGALHRFEPSSSAYYGSCIKDPDSGKFILAFSKGSNGQLHMQTATISSGNNMTFGSQVGCTDNSSQEHWHPRICYDTVNDLIVCVYNSETGSNTGIRRLIAASVSGTSITFKTPDNLGSSWDANQCGHHDINWDPSINKAIVWHVDSGNSWYLMANKVYHSGNASDQYAYEAEIIVQGAAQEQQSGRTLNDAIYVGGGQHFLYGKQNVDNKGYLHAVSAGTITLNSNGFDNIGFSKAAYSNGANATIKTVGNIVNNQSSLTIGANYFLQNDGSYATTRQLGFGGFRAISATSGIITSGTNHNTYGSVLEEWFMAGPSSGAKCSGSTYLNDNNWNNISGNSGVEMKQIALHHGQQGITWGGSDGSAIIFPETGKWKMEWTGHVKDCSDNVTFQFYRSTNGASGPWERQNDQQVRDSSGGYANVFYLCAYLNIDDVTKNYCSVKVEGAGNSTATRISTGSTAKDAGNRLTFTKIS